jgi:hypothetical protein
MDGVCVCVWIPNIFFMLYSCPIINHGELCTHHRLRIYIIAPKCLTYLPTYIVTIVQIDPGRQLLYTWLVSPLDGRGCNQNVVVTLATTSGDTIILVTPLTLGLTYGLHW